MARCSGRAKGDRPPQPRRGEAVLRVRWPAATVSVALLVFGVRPAGAVAGVAGARECGRHGTRGREVARSRPSGGALKVGSLFAGIGGFDLGFERAGMQTLWQVEQSEFRRDVLARHFPDAERFEDVREVGAHNLAPVDVICGGFPCQDISLAGKGAGIDGDRSGLWSEMFRVVCELEPRWIVVENVPALTSRGLDRVLRDLAAGGYDAEWDCLPASAFGALHRRDRLWLVAYPAAESRLEGAGRSGLRPAIGYELAWSGERGALRPAEAVADPEGEPIGPGLRADGSGGQRRGRSSDSGGSRRVPDADSEQHEGTSHALGWQASEELRDHWATEPDVGRVADGVPARVDRLAALGDSLVPQIAEWIGRRLMEAERG
jgi:DNA (cytosine-5)-methyltransferase 1